MTNGVVADDSEVTIEHDGFDNGRFWPVAAVTGIAKAVKAWLSNRNSTYEKLDKPNNAPSTTPVAVIDEVLSKVL